MTYLAPSTDGATQRVSRKVDALLNAAARPLPTSAPRSTALQRQAFLEHLYSDYSELHAQQGEIHDRKNHIDLDLFESNQQEIHDVLFANVEGAEGALGDWDTWEKVEAVIKRCAYGRPRHAAQERDEDAALRSRIAALSDVASERNTTIQSLTQTCTALQQELGGLLKLLNMKSNEIKTLRNQHHVAQLHLRYVQRECAALRGLRTENETSLLKQDLKYLIEANKKLEAENQLLRGRQQVLERAMKKAQSSSTAPPQEEAPAADRPVELSSALAELQPPSPSSVESDTLDKCIEDDVFRRDFLRKEVPISSTVLGAKQETANWKRRVEAEVDSAMTMLDHDAAAPVEVMPSAASVAQLQNGVFISYASYENAPQMRAQLSTTPVLMAPVTTASATSTASTATVAHTGVDTSAAATNTATKTTASATTTAATPTPAAANTAEKPATAAAPPLVAATGETGGARASLSSDTRKVHRKSMTSVSHNTRGPLAKATAAATSRKSTRGATTSPRKGSGAAQTAAAVAADAFAPLHSAILHCAELSRANAMRRELLHVAYLRQMLADEIARASANVPGETSDMGAASVASEGDNVRQQQGGNTRASTTAPFAATETLPVRNLSQEEAVPTSAPERLRQRVNETRSSSLDIPVGEPDGGEVQSSAPLTLLTTATPARPPSPTGGAAAHQNIPPPLTRTPTPPPSLSRTSSSRVHSSGGEWAKANASLPAFALSQLVAPLREYASTLRDEVAGLRAHVVTYWTELQEALALLRTLFAENEMQLIQAVETRANEEAVEGAVERALEEAALQRTTQVLRERFDVVLPPNAFTPATLPDSATDEEWLVHELHTAAAAIIKESMRPQAGSSTEAGGAKDGAVRPVGLSPAYSAGSKLPSSDHPHGTAADRDYFDAEILRPFRMQPNFGNGGTSRRRRNDWSRSDDAAGDEDGGIAGGAGGAARAEDRAVGGFDGRARSRPAPPTRWHWRIRSDAPNFWANERRTAPLPLPPRRAVPLITADSPPSAPASLQSIQPTVLRYVFGSGDNTTHQRAVSQHIQEKTAFLYGSEFERFVQEYIVPVISTASRISADGKMGAAMRAAVQDLRQRERQRRKRGVRLLFDRIANNIRTRQLLQRNVYRGEAFVSYVRLMYSNWRAKLERDRRRVQCAQDSNRNALFSLLHLHPPTLPNDTFTKPSPPPPPPSNKTKLAAGGSTRTANAALTKSSFHFDKAKFNAQP